MIQQVLLHGVIIIRVFSLLVRAVILVTLIILVNLIRRILDIRLIVISKVKCKSLPCSTPQITTHEHVSRRLWRLVIILVVLATRIRSVFIKVIIQHVPKLLLMLVPIQRHILVILIIITITIAGAGPLRSNFVVVVI